MRLAYIIFFLLIHNFSFAQEGNIEELLVRAENIIYSDPQEAIRIAEYISNKSNESSEVFQASFILTRAYYIEGKYDEALKIGLNYSEEEINNDSNTHIQLNILLSKILTELDLHSLADYYCKKANNLLNRASDIDTKNWVEGKTMQYAVNKIQADSTKKILHQFYKAKNKFKSQSIGTYSFQIGNIDLDLAESHLREFQLDSAEAYLSTALIESKKEKSANYLEMKSLIKYGNYLFLKNAYSQAIDTLNSAMKIAEKFGNTSEQITIYKAISENHLALNNLEEFNNYNTKADELNSIRGDIENDAVNTAYNIFNNNETQKFDFLRAKSKWFLLILSGVLSLLLLFWGFTIWRYRYKISQYQKFINYLDKRKEIVDVSPPIKLSVPKSLNVPKEAEDILLKKLIAFESSLDFTNNDISLSRLALQFETNTKYLSEVVNTHKQKNFNTYINELRINYIIDKLNNDPQYLQFKISYLAKESGFSSHSVFATVFKSVTGISPTTFISLLQNKQESPAA